jgi:ribosomal protein L37AE/L43A
MKTCRLYGEEELILPDEVKSGLCIEYTVALVDIRAGKLFPDGEGGYATAAGVISAAIKRAEKLTSFKYKYEVRMTVFVESNDIMEPDEVLQVAQFAHKPEPRILSGNVDTFVCLTCGHTHTKRASGSLICAECRAHVDSGRWNPRLRLSGCEKDLINQLSESN